MDKKTFGDARDLIRVLAYAENRCQNPSNLMGVEDDPLAMHNFVVEAGNPSYISIADGDTILDILCVLAETFRRWKNKVPYMVIAGKHGNPCGCSVDWESPEKALLKALLGDPVAVMGGEIITNFPITDELGQLLFAVPKDINIGRDKWGLDIVFAPEFSEQTIELLGKREKRRLLSNPALINPELPQKERMEKEIRGGKLTQKVNPFILTTRDVDFWVGPDFTEEEQETLFIAWAVGWRASSNTVSLGKDRMLIGLGCGQQDRIACVRLCLDRANRAGHDSKGSLFASDAFFPYAVSQPPVIDQEFIDSLKFMLAKADFSEKRALLILSNIAQKIVKIDNREGPELLRDAGCRGGVVPADGNKLEEEKDLFEKAGMTIAFVNKENRGFSKH